MQRKSVLITSVCTLTLLTFSQLVYAASGQWSNNGSTIFYTEGHVGIGLANASRARLNTRADASNSYALQMISDTSGRGFELVSRNFNPSQNLGSVLETALSSSSDTAYPKIQAFTYGKSQKGNLALQDRGGRLAIGGVDFGRARLNVGAADLSSYGISTRSDSEGRSMELLTSNFDYINDSGAALTFSFTNSNSDMSLQAKKQGKSVNANLILQPQGGKVGIGTESPKHTLAVNGTIHAREIVVDNIASNWPDYVFSEDYDLMSLKDLRTYINDKSHLPGVDSAGVVKDRGISLGEMQKKQLEKIEELTLYILELEARIDKLEGSKI